MGHRNHGLHAPGGGRSRISALINLPLWLDPAGPFVLLSGLVLGMGARGDKPLRRVWKRARELWLIHIGWMVVVLFVHETTGRLRAPSLAAAGGVLGALWKVPTLRLQALDYMNILPLFVVFFAAAPLVIIAMRRGGTLACLVVSLTLWLVTQRDPGWLRFTDVASGEEAFVLPAWQFPFLLGLACGFHGRAIAAHFSRHRGWLVPMMATLSGGVFVLAQLQRKVALRLGCHLPKALDWVFAKETWGPGRAAYTVSLLGLGYLGIDWLLGPGRGEGARPLEVLGRRSLYSFLVHLPLALLFSGLGLYFAPIFVQDLAAVLSLVAVYHMARNDVLGRYIPN